jgi:catechol 2,3-dioxygenase-like lactoylglutathione lyase family enzyme
MLSDATPVCFVATTDGARARRFYGDLLGLRVVSDDPYAIVFDARGTTLRVQKVGALGPQEFTVLGWQVANISATVQGLARRGVTFQRYEGMDQDGDGIWTSPSGSRVAWFKDPDGNVLSLTEM